MIRLFFTAIFSLLLAACMSQAPAPAVDRSSAAKSAAPASGPGYYTVKRGDSLYRIAAAHGKDQKDIAAWNNLDNVNVIKEGQVLRVAPPTGESSAEVVATPVLGLPAVESRSLDEASGGGGSPPVSAVPASPLKREPRGGKEPYSDEAYARLNNLPEVPKAAEVKPEEPTVPPPTPAAAPDGVVWGWPASGKIIASFGRAGNKGLDIAGQSGDAVLAAADGKVVYVGPGFPGYAQLIIIKHNAIYLSAYANNRKILVKEKDQVTRGQKIAEMGNPGGGAVKLHFEIRKQATPIDPLPYLPAR
jgi:lipoprotein NlpD